MSRVSSKLPRLLLDKGPVTRAESIAIALASAGFAAVFCSILLAHLTTAGTFSDWDFWLTLEWVADRSVRHYHQIPQWSPYTCGGNAMIGNPGSNVLTPWFLLTLVFGPVVGLHLEVLIHCAIAWSGGYVLGRKLKMSRVAAIFPATTYAGSSWFFLHTAEGHVSFLAFAYLPWILAAGWAAATERRRLRYTIVCGALIALSFFQGGPYAPLFEALSLGIILPVIAAMRLSLRPLLALLLIGLFTGGFAAIKYFPSREVIAAHPRATDAGYSNSVKALSVALFSRDQDHSRNSLGNWGFWESGAYIGLFSVVALMGLLSPRRAIPWVIAAIILFILARGWTGPNCAWVWLHRLPVFSSTRLPQRLLIPFTLAIGVLAGIGIDTLCANQSIVTLGIALVLITVGASDLYVVGTPNLRYALEGVPSEQVFEQHFRQFQMEAVGGMFKLVHRNVGITNCYDAITWKTAVAASNGPGYRGEYYLLGSGSVTNSLWSPNELGFAVDAPAATVLVINQNYDRSWRVMSGIGPTFSENGLLAVRVAPGRSEIYLRFVSGALLTGFAITLLTVIGAIVFFKAEPRFVSQPIAARDTSMNRAEASL